METHASAADAYQAALQYLDQQQMQEAEIILGELLNRFPQKLRYHEAMLEALFRQGKTEQAFDVVRALMDRFKLTNDPAYDAIYIDGLRATTNSPLPLGRIVRFYELVKQFQRILPLTGDVVECGCYRGMSSFLLCSYLRNHNVGFNGSGYHIFDSFQGLGEPTTEDEIPHGHKDARRLQKMSGPGNFSASLETVQRNLSAFPGIKYHPGWIPLTFRCLPEKNYRFVHVDVDLYDPTWDCLEYFYPRLVMGGALVSDDYGWPGARKAIKEFCVERRIEVNVTGFNQAILFKT